MNSIREKEYNNDLIAEMFPFLMYAEFQDGASLYIYDESEADCMCVIGKLTDYHGDVTYYTPVNNLDRTDGEWIGRNNYVYV